MNQLNFWDVLFDSNENVCFASTIYDTEINAITTEPQTKKQFFSINPLSISRKDANVTCFRNILIEFDKVSLEKQLEFAETIPFSTLTFSGSKSYHYIISLEEPCKDIKEYRRLVKRIYNNLPDCDKSTKNPSRLSRTPGAIRDNNNEQKLLAVKNRIKRKDLELWLGPVPVMKDYEGHVSEMYGKRLLPVRTLAFIRYGAPEGRRNQALFINACEMFRAGYGRDEIYEIATKVLDLPEYEINQCISSAEKAARIP